MRLFLTLRNKSGANPITCSDPAIEDLTNKLRTQLEEAEGRIRGLEKALDSSSTIIEMPATLFDTSSNTNLPGNIKHDVAAQPSDLISNSDGIVGSENLSEEDEDSEEAEEEDEEEEARREAEAQRLYEERKAAEQQVLMEALEDLKAETRRKEEEVRRMEEEARQKDEVIRKRELGVLKMDEARKRKEDEVMKKEEDAKKKWREVKERELNVQRKADDVEKLDEEIRRKEQECQEKEAALFAREEQVKRREGEVKRKEEEQAHKLEARLKAENAPPYLGAPPIPPGISVNPQAWSAGVWEYNPAYNHNRNPQQQPVRRVPAHLPLPKQESQPQLSNPLQQPAQSSQAARRVSFDPHMKRPPEASDEYYATELSANPLGLFNMVPATE